MTAVALLLGAGRASAQSAADKATAREAATQGIGLYRAGKYADALDKLKRAQALYDAPVHLLYIARCQAKLGQLVEAAENYRLLDHYALPSDAPAAWKSAVDDGSKELGEVEPRVPKLKIVTDPANVSGATLTIDGATVSSAVVGIERPTNPGKHHVAISAPSFSPAEADTTLTEGQTAEVTLHLTPGAGAAAAAVPSATPAVSVPPPKAEPAPKPEGRSLVGFLGGLRLGVGVPVGTLLHSNVMGVPERDISASDAFGAGGALELHVGVRIARYFTPVVLVEAETLSSGDGLFPNIKTTLSNTRAGAFGVGVMIGSAPGKLGGFGELDFLPLTSFNLTTTAPLQPEKTCDIAAKGGAIRFGGGANFPVLDWLHITPVFLATLGTFTHLDQSGTCDAYGGSADIASANRRTHGMLFFGVGGDVVLGRDK